MVEHIRTTMHRKMLVAFLAFLGLVLSSVQARSIEDYYNFKPDDDGILPLPNYNFEPKENSEEDAVAPNLYTRFGGPINFDDAKEAPNGVVLRNKFGSDENDDTVEQKQPNWLKRQWIRLANVATGDRARKMVSPAKVAEFTERVCNGFKAMVNRAAKICEVVPLKFCASFYESSKDPDAITLPESNSLET